MEKIWVLQMGKKKTQGKEKVIDLFWKLSGRGTDIAAVM